MPFDPHPIPQEALPPRWGPVECDDDCFVYRHTRPPIELVADRTAADRSHPSLGLSRCWELRYRYSLGNRSISDAIGRVSTRRAAIDGLLECMHRVHDYVEESSDPVEIQSVLEGVSLGNLVPDSTTR